MENLERCYKIVQQSCPKGIRSVEVAHKLGVHKTTAHSYLNTLELMGKVYNQHGFWYVKEKERYEKFSKKLSKEEREYLERRAEFYEEAEWLASQWEVFEPLKSYADISRKIRKDLGLEG